MTPPSTPRNWQRLMIASMAILLTIAGCIIHFSPSLEAGGAQFLSGVLWKIAMVLGLAWVASPQLERWGWQRVRGTMLVAIVLVIILYAIRPRFGAIAAIVLVALSCVAAIGGWIRKLAR